MWEKAQAIWHIISTPGTEVAKEGVNKAVQGAGNMVVSKTPWIIEAGFHLAFALLMIGFLAYMIRLPIYGKVIKWSISGVVIMGVLKIVLSA